MTTIDPAMESARAMLETQMAEGIRAISSLKEMTIRLQRLKSAIAVADERVAQLSTQCTQLSSERDFYMRYAATVTARLDNIFGSVTMAMENIKDASVAFDSIARITREQGDKAHSAYLLLSSLVTTIEAAKLDGKDAAFRPRMEIAQTPQSEPAAEANSEPPAPSLPKEPPVPMIVRRGPRAS